MDAQIKRARYLSSKEFSVLFAQTVHIFPSIWNRSLQENRSLIVVNVAWEKIASILGNGLTAKQCQQKWRTMRNNYTAQLRKAARNGTDLVFLNGAMDFVRPYTISGLGYPAGNGNDSSSDWSVPVSISLWNCRMTNRKLRQRRRMVTAKIRLVTTMKMLRQLASTSR
uniref:(northern house mosquito) hypothetical protein n=1 Tax=Culex pipiens TaxID=7175 RepID=A0A8D8KE83_CULPI